MQITLPTSTVYYDVHAATGFVAGQSIIIRNETSSTLHVIISPTLPTSDTGSIALVNDLKVKVNAIIAALKS